MAQEFFFTNSQTSKKEKFTPDDPANVRFYSCGPTVYGLIHIGNLRAALTADLIARALKQAGYGVNYVRNYTDVDDKIIDKSIHEKTTIDSITKKYTTEVELDYRVTGMIEPTHKTKATEHFPEMIDMIERLIKNGHAYEVKGEVLFAIDSFKTYGKLSRKPIEDLQAGARVEISTIKKNPMDFTLWKPAKPGEPSWPSPWGNGRPGWHIECSAMARKWLGDQIDIHHGGVDLIFPHHENEVAQTEGVTQKPPFSKTWVHNEHLTLDKEKMSKSLGNVWTARDFLTRYNGEIARLVLLGSHYRSRFDITESLIDQALKEIERIYDAKQKALECMNHKGKVGDPRAEQMWGNFAADCQQASNKIRAAYANDLNTPEAMSALFGLIREFNRLLSEPLAMATPSVALGAQAFIQVIEKDIGEVIGVGLLKPEKMREDLSRIRASRQTSVKGGALPAEEIEKQIAERIAARKNKDFKRADEIRKQLLDKGVEIKDGPGGTTWVYV